MVILMKNETKLFIRTVLLVTIYYLSLAVSLRRLSDVFCVSVCVCVFLSLCLSDWLSDCLSVSMYINLSVSLLYKPFNPILQYFALNSIRWNCNHGVWSRKWWWMWWRWATTTMMKAMMKVVVIIVVVIEDSNWLIDSRSKDTRRSHAADHVTNRPSTWPLPHQIPSPIPPNSIPHSIPNRASPRRWPISTKGTF